MAIQAILHINKGNMNPTETGAIKPEPPGISANAPAMNH